MKKYLTKMILTVFFLLAGISCLPASIQSVEAKAKKQVSFEAALWSSRDKLRGTVEPAAV